MYNFIGIFILIDSYDSDFSFLNFRYDIVMSLQSSLRFGHYQILLYNIGFGVMRRNTRAYFEITSDYRYSHGGFLGISPVDWSIHEHFSGQVVVLGVI